MRGAISFPDGYRTSVICVPVGCVGCGEAYHAYLIFGYVCIIPEVEDY